MIFLQPQKSTRIIPKYLLLPSIGTEISLQLLQCHRFNWRHISGAQRCGIASIAPFYKIKWKLAHSGCMNLSVKYFLEKILVITNLPFLGRHLTWFDIGRGECWRGFEASKRRHLGKEQATQFYQRPRACNVEKGTAVKICLSKNKFCAIEHLIWKEERKMLNIRAKDLQLLEYSSKSSENHVSDNCKW